ncbi:MAG: DUF455 family protein, partial [Maioricimonas sp. JB049]
VRDAILALVTKSANDVACAVGEFLGGSESAFAQQMTERARRLGVRFGELPVNCYIWKKAQEFRSVLDYLAGLPLVFEGRNLDHTCELAEAFEAAGDPRSARLMQVIHEDEIEHVRFGIEWLRRLKREDQSDWDAFVDHLHWPLRPGKARGSVFQREARLAAGLDTEFVDRLERWTDEDSVERK